MDYKNLTDEELVALSKNGDETARDTLIVRYKNSVIIKSKKYYNKRNKSSDPKEKDNDFIQAGLLGVCDAIEDYDPDIGIKFKTFANTCIFRAIISEVRRQTKGAENIKDVVTSKDEDGQEYSVIDEIEDPILVPANIQSEKDEGKRLLYERLSKYLSEQEILILKLYFQQYSYDEIAKQVGVNNRKIDNTILKIKKIIKEHRNMFDDLF
ncbi:MAG: sigma-70 family RNA polymerase sigma factor [Clostridia bacterium]|nr:sigma-70 family RNA polymerase sigma factor [Clostridia bacterium]